MYLHREILPPPPGMEVDHRNRDKLDNRRVNLRHLTRAQQQQNVSARGASTVRGVDLIHRTGRWRARGYQDGLGVHVGYYATAEEADAAVVAWRAEHMPFATG